MFTDTTTKSRRNRLSPYTAAERRLNKASVVAAADPISMRHLERGLSRKSHARKTQC
jgi:hypothetical protein